MDRYFSYSYFVRRDNNARSHRKPGSRALARRCQRPARCVARVLGRSRPRVDRLWPWLDRIRHPARPTPPRRWPRISSRRWPSRSRVTSTSRRETIRRRSQHTTRSALEHRPRPKVLHHAPQCMLLSRRHRTSCHRPCASIVHREPSRRLARLTSSAARLAPDLHVRARLLAGRRGNGDGGRHPRTDHHARLFRRDGPNP